MYEQSNGFVKLALKWKGDLIPRDSEDPSPLWIPAFLMTERGLVKHLLPYDALSLHKGKTIISLCPNVGSELCIGPCAH